jgi:hypothetical protein
VLPLPAIASAARGKKPAAEAKKEVRTFVRSLQYRLFYYTT